MFDIIGRSNTEDNNQRQIIICAQDAGGNLYNLNENLYSIQSHDIIGRPNTEDNNQRQIIICAQDA